ncbi:MAG: tRNA (adenosine(37)-N6)-dimethylallyltransferase MiaA [Candidatus Eisenbacteria bacterium]|uniref:tRNA dimethylallyltransferase n=1 Tax=Eiseniibacteriota bacterium TaxID=2212470 RepID=A0A933W8A6_UNCEI|nr:tRNA (adenosine(37)-N6)-dimethylallyltransferase MiaA [Candidatus Eisenbacteria bacterium]
MSAAVPPRTVVVIAGATATGKTDLGAALAAECGGEVVCADARQVFRELDVGTGKPTAAERAARPHHLFDALSLGDKPSAGWYARAASDACERLFARGVTPVLVGGSGLYLRALIEGLHAEPPHDEGVRLRLRAELEASGPEALHERLAAVDPVTAARLAPRDRQRITRALEVHEASGRPLSWWHAQETRAGLSATFRVIEVEVDAEALAERIAVRSRAMFAAGLLEETRALVDAGRRDALVALKAIGYDEALAILEGRMSRSEGEAVMNDRTRSMAKRQRTWFRHQLAATRVAGGPDFAALLAAARAALFPAGV